MLRLLPFALLLLGCAPQTLERPVEEPAMVTPNPARPDQAACRADEFQSLVGRTHEDLLTTRILGPVRIIRPDQAVTMDFIATRLNIVLDENEVVTRVYCG